MFLVFSVYWLNLAYQIWIGFVFMYCLKLKFKYKITFKIFVYELWNTQRLFCSKKMVLNISIKAFQRTNIFSIWFPPEAGYPRILWNHLVNWKWFYYVLGISLIPLYIIYDYHFTLILFILSYVVFLISLLFHYILNSPFFTL